MFDLTFTFKLIKKINIYQSTNCIILYFRLLKELCKFSIILTVYYFKKYKFHTKTRKMLNNIKKLTLL